MSRLLLCLAALAACDRDPAPATTVLALRVTADGTPTAARVQLFDQSKGGTEPLHAGSIDLFGARQGATACVIAPGVTATWNGIVLAAGTAELPVGADRCEPSPAIPYGRYRVVAWKGIEHERWEGTVDLSAGRGRVELAIVLERAWQPTGWLAADFHVHAHGSNDSNMPFAQRAAAQAAAGIQVTALTDHNVTGTLADAIREVGLDGVLVGLPSIELTSDQTHANVFPVPLGSEPPAASIVGASPTALFAAARAFPGDPIVQLNHPRFRVTALFDGTGWDGTSWPPPFPRGFDAFEVINGFTAFSVDGDRRIDDGVRDLYTFTDHGWIVSAHGASDTHDYNWVHDGLARTYVHAPGVQVQPFDQRAFVAALRAHRTLATTGPWLEVTVAAAQGAPGVGPGELARADQGAVWVTVTVAQARFVKLERIRITVGTPAGPTLVHTLPVPPNVRTHTWSGRLDLGTQDTWIGVTTDGDTPLPVEQTGTYQRDKWRRAGNTPAAVITPVLVDADGDGRWTR